ncbi:unnamed protein product [Adineta steineri]|uniref:nicotinamidase n=1 Tax=Adineta steineri TaxID=433720 RepID=A0A814DSL6_9BILA|nr:unnamed protein product [Adineta steineri]CAF0962398.1 unnamed protein product [Adineta steineri]
MEYNKLNGWTIVLLIISIGGIQAHISEDETTTVERSSKKNVYALIMIDVQYCFINGSLALSNGPAGQDGAEVIPVINELIDKVPFDVFAYSLDWHPANHISFFENLESRKDYVLGSDHEKYQMFDAVTYTGPGSETTQILWPAHCIQDTDEAKLHKDLIRLPAGDNVVYINKGRNPNIDSYSAFLDNDKIEKTPLDNELKARNVTHVFVTGLALDYCVGSTAIDASNFGYKTYVIEDACRGVDDIAIEAKLNQLEQNGVELINSHQVEQIINSLNSQQNVIDTCSSNKRYDITDENQDDININSCQ